MNRFAFILAFSVLGFAGAPARASEAFAVDNLNDFYRIDFALGTAQLIGNTGVLLEDLATSPTGVIYGCDPGGSLWTVNPATAVATFVGPTFLGNIEAIDFNAATLLAVDFSPTPSIYRLSTKWALSTWVATADTVTGAVRSAATLDSEHLLIRGDLNGDTLFNIRLTDGAVSTIGVMSDTIYGMDFLDGTLYGAGDHGELFSIDPLTAQMTLVADVGDQFFLGMTTVPEPATLTIAGAAILLALRRRIRG